MVTNKLTRILISPTHYVLDKNHGGSEFYWSYSIYKYLSKFPGIKYEFKYITGQTNINDKDIINLDVFSIMKLNLSIFNIIRFYIKIFFGTLNEILRFKPKILHHVLPFQISYSFNLFFFPPLKKILKIKCVIGPIQSPLLIKDTDLDVGDARNQTRKNNLLSYFFNNLIIKLIRPMVNILSKTTLKNADRIIVINQYTLEILTKFGISTNKIVIIPVGIDNTSTRHQIGNTDRIRLITVSKLVKRKGVIDIIEMMRQIIEKTKITDIQLTIIGDGPEYNNIKNKITEYNLSEHIEMLGYISHEELGNYYRKANLFISLSRDESWGQMYLEAMSHSLPVLALVNNGSSSIVKNKYNGFLIEDNGNKITNANNHLEYLFEHKKYWHKMSLNAYTSVKTNYDWNIIMKHYLEIYDQII